jgi:NAD(P)-dependent dehydrogenase (short-subunit alcohol dehydrogenase family)
MKIVVIGGSGLIGSKLVSKLREHGHEATSASPESGVNTLTGEGLAEALEGASVVVDVSNSPSFEDFGLSPSERALLPGPDARIAGLRFGRWLQQQLATA